MKASGLLARGVKAVACGLRGDKGAAVRVETSGLGLRNRRVGEIAVALMAVGGARVENAPYWARKSAGGAAA